MNDPLTDLATVPPIPLHGALPGARASIRPDRRPISSPSPTTRSSATGAGARPTPTMSSSATASTRSTSGSSGDRRDRGRARRGDRRRRAARTGRPRARGDDRGPLGPPRGPAPARRRDLGRRSGRRRMDGPPDARAHPRRPAVVRLVQRLVPEPSGPRRRGRVRPPDERPRRPNRPRRSSRRGTPAEVAARFDAIADASAAAVAGLDAAALDARGALVGLPVSIGFRLGSLRLAHPRAHDPGRQDAGDARPRADRDRTARPARPRDLRPARGARHRRGRPTWTGRSPAVERDRILTDGARRAASRASDVDGQLT